MTLELLYVLFGILCFQLIFVAIFLLQSKKGKPISNKLLGLIFLMLAISVIDILFAITGTFDTWPKILLLDDIFILAYGPLIFYFTQSVLYKDYGTRQLNFLHLVPFFLIALYILWFITRMTDVDQIQVSEQLDITNLDLRQRVIEFGMLAHIITYLILSKIEVRKALKSAHETNSLINEENIKWLSFILNSFNLLFAVALIHSILPFAGIQQGLAISLFAIIGFIFYFVIQVLLKMLNQTTNRSGIITIDDLNLNKKYEGSNLSKEQLQLIKDGLLKIMSSERPYLENDLSLSDLALRLDCSPKYLSQVINEVYTCNFFDFINKYRIEEAKKQLSNRSDEKLTVLEVLYASGFNSKSSFNTAFKKFTGQTPSQFKKNQ